MTNTKNQNTYIEALKSTMTVRQTGLNGPLAVLTTAPWLWLGDSRITSQDKIIDVSFKFQRHAQLGGSVYGTMRNSSSAKTELYDRLVFAGWTPEQIETHSSRIIEGLGPSDFLIRIDDKPFVTFYMVHNQFLAAEDERTLFTRVVQGHTTRWVVLTDGTAFRVFDTSKLESLFLCQPPNPELLGLLDQSGTNESSHIREILDELSYRLSSRHAGTPDKLEEIVEWLEFADCRNWGDAAKANVTSLQICEQFTNVGWKREELFRQDPSNEIAIRSEITVRDRGTFPLIAVCLVSTAVMTEERNTSLFDRHVDSFPDLPRVVWLAITDGITFKLKNLLTNEMICLNRPPSREILFATQGSILSQMSVFKPITTAQLTHFIDELEPSAITLDFTIDSEKSIPINGYIDLDEIECDHGLDELVSKAGQWMPSYSDDREFYDNPDDEPSVTLQQIIVSWLSRNTFVEQISFAASRQVLSSLKYKRFREDIVNHIPLAAVLEVPSSSESEGRIPNNTQDFVIYMARSFEQTLFQRLTSSQLNCEHGPEILRLWLNERKLLEGGSASLATLESWEPRAYANFLLQLKERLNRIGPLKQLSNLAHIYEQYQVRPADSQSKDPDSQRKVELRILNVQYLKTGIAKKVLVPEKSLGLALEAGDILIPRMITRDINCALYNDSVASVAGDDVLVVTAHKSEQASYIYAFLTSSAGKELLMATGKPIGDGVELTVRDLDDLPIPECPNHEGLDSMRDLAFIEAQLQAKVREFSTQRRELFDEPNAKKFLSKTAELRRHGRILNTGLDRAVEFEYRVSNFYPYPIAFPFRALQSQTVPAEQYQAQLRLAENILAFLASISLAIASNKGDLDTTGIDFKDIWIGGASPGHWKEIVRACGANFQHYTDNALALRISHLDIAATGKTFGKSVASLIGNKNDFKHDRGPSNTDQFIDCIPENQNWLIQCMKSIMFLTEYPIRQVCDSDESRQGQIELTCLRLDGDHQAFKKEQLAYRKHLKKRDLFLEISSDFWIPLYPFVQLLACKTCGAPECYFIDKLDYSRKTATLKSFERGHTADSADVGETLCKIIESQQLHTPTVGKQLS